MFYLGGGLNNYKKKGSSLFLDKLSFDIFVTEYLSIKPNKIMTQTYLRFTLLGLILSVSFSVFAQDYLYSFNTKDYKYGYMDKNGVVKIEAQFDQVETHVFRIDELASVYNYDRKGPRYIDENGKVVISLPGVTFAASFEGQQLAEIEKKNKKGFINKKGEVIVEPTYMWVGAFDQSGLALVMLEMNKFGFVDETGVIKIPLDYEQAYSFYESDLTFVYKDGKAGYINNQGALVIPHQFEYVHQFGKNGLAIFQKDKKFGFINKKGEVVIEPIYEHAYGFGEGDFAGVMVKGKFGFIDKKGQMVIPAKFVATQNRTFRKGDLMPVLRNRKWGFINDRGDMVIEPQFDGVDTFRDFEIAGFRKGKEWGFIDKTGKILIEASFDEINNFELSGHCELIRVKFGERQGFVNNKGNYLGFTQKELDEEPKSSDIESIDFID